MNKMIPYLLGLVVAGAVGAAMALGVGTTERPESSDGGEVARLRAEVTELRRDLAEVRDSIEMRGIAPGAVPSADGRPAALPAPAETGMDRTADASPASPEAPAPEAMKAIDERVKNVVAAEQKKRQEAIGKRFESMAIEREKSMLDRMTEEHGLTSHQRGEMEKILGRRREAIGEMFRTMFSGGGEGVPDFAEVRKKISVVRTESDQELKVLLSPDQYEAFEKEEQASGMGGPPWMRSQPRNENEGERGR